MFERLFSRLHTLNLSLSVVIEPDESGFHGYVPAFKGLHVDGATVEETAKNLGKAIGVYLESLSREGDPLPIGPDLTVHEDPMRDIPAQAQLRSVTVKWPSLQMSGIR